MARGKGPGFTRFFRPIVEALKEKGGSGTTTEIIDRAIELLGLSESEQNVELSSGGSKVRNQAQWARLYLVRGDLLDSSARGVWRLTEQGSQLSPATFEFLSLFKKVSKKFQEERKHDRITTTKRQLKFQTRKKPQKIIASGS